MSKIIIYVAIAVSLFISKSYAQETFESRAKQIANNIENITKSEKETLKKEIESINIQLNKSEITFDQAMAKKQELAEIRAKKIEDKVAIEQQKLNDLVKEKVDGKIVEVEKQKSRFHGFSIKYGKKDSITNKQKSYNWGFKKRDSVINWENKYRTTIQIVLATGLNNVVTNNSVANSDFRYFGSHFYEFGMTLNTRLSKTNNLLHLKYGFSTVLNNLRPTNNREFGVIGNQTNLQTSPIKLEDSRFRNAQIIFPIHLEFDFTKPIENNGKTFFDSHKKLRFGIGGFTGFTDETIQFSEISINKYVTESETKGDFNTSNFIYGLSTYVGYKATSLYIKYDLNPLFRNNTIKQNNISLGIRWDLN